MRPSRNLFGLTLLLLMVGGCTPTTDPPTTGSVQASLSMTGVDLDADGVTMTIDGGSEQTVNAGGSATFSDLSPGDHVVQIGDVADNCQVDGGLSRTATVTAGQTTNVAFAVTCNEIVVISGVWDYVSSFQLSGVACTWAFSLSLTEAAGTFSGSYTGRLACPSAGIDDPFAGSVVNGVINGTQIAFDFDDSRIHHTGSIAGISMTGSGAIILDSGTIDMTWSATRVGNLPLTATPRGSAGGATELVRRANERISN